MNRDALTRILLILITVLVAWDVFSRELRPVQAQSPYTVIRLGSSPSDWMRQLNDHGRKLVAVVPEHHNESAQLDHRNDSYIVILQ
jgi:hypothetical protein